MSEPTAKGLQGDRDAHGRFVSGHSISSPGNPHSAQIQRLRSALINAVTEADMRDVIQAILDKAKSGDVQAARVLLNRCLGPSQALDILERISMLEQAVDS